MSLKSVTTVDNTGGDLDPSFEIFLVTLSGIGTTTSILPTIMADGMNYIIKRKDVSLRTYEIAGFGTETIDGLASITLAINLATIRVISLGGAWYTY